MVRRRRAAPTPGVVAVTGAASGLGRALAERLAGRADLDGLLGIDVVPARIDGVVWRTADVCDPQLADRLVNVTTLVHLATSYDVGAAPSSRSELNVVGTGEAITAAEKMGVRRVVLCTSSDVYGCRPDNPVPLADGAPLAARAEPGSLLADHLEVERLATEARGRGLDVVVLRPACIAGLGAAYEGPVLRQLAGPRLLALKGVEPVWQLCHVDDLVGALELAVLGTVSGTVGVACDGALEQAQVERLVGKHRIELPATLALATAERLHRLGASTTGPREFDHLLGPLVLACDGLRAAGWEPAWTNEAALRAHLAARGDVRAAAYTAAGATVALLGTAALIRQARRRRRI